MIKKNKAFKFLLKPTKEQTIFFNKTFGCCRLVYNTMLADRINSYKKTGKTSSRTPAEIKKEFPFLREVDSFALASEWINLNKAYSNFFKDKKKGFPKFKTKKNDRKSYTVFNQADRIKFTGKYIKLPKIKLVKCRQHRQIPEDWKIKSATISQSSNGKYYVSVICEYFIEEPKKVVPNIDSSIGIDYMSNGLGMTSNGEVLSRHRYFRESQSKLAKEQRKLSRKKKGSKNFYKQKQKVNKVHEHIRNQRFDRAHKISRMLVNSYDLIAFEGINLQNISQCFKLSKSTYDNGFGMIRNFTKYKAEDTGKIYMELDKFTPTSIVCSNCGAYHKDIVNSLAVRKWTCPDCGATHDRDINAARNILKEGFKIYNKNCTRG